jgi:hypothetical protein
VSANATACQGATIASYSWTNNSSTASSFSTSAANTYCVTVTQSGNGCTASSCTTLAVDTVRPTCSITAPTSAIGCNVAGLTITASVSNSQAGITYAWSLISGTGYVITSGNTATLTYTSGTGVAVFELLVTNPNGCSSTCQVTVDAQCDRFCTYTQGFYGNGNGRACSGQRSLAFVTSLLANPLTIGAGVNSITFTAADASCLQGRMPSGGPATVINGTATCQNPSPAITLFNGKFRNILLGQTITLGLNMRIGTGMLGSVQITGTYLVSYPSTGVGCGNTGTQNGSASYYAIPSVVISYLNANGGATIANLYALANAALGQAYTPAAGTPSLSQINQAVDAFNRGFDGCRIFGGFTNTLPATSRAIEVTEEADMLEANGVVMKAYPNPFNTKTTIEFMFNDYTSNVSVDVYNLAGEKVASLFNGNVSAGARNTVEFDGSLLPEGIYIYRIYTADQMYHNKMIMMK